MKWETIIYKFYNKIFGLENMTFNICVEDEKYVLDLEKEVYNNEKRSI